MVHPSSTPRPSASSTQVATEPVLTTGRLNEENAKGHLVATCRATLSFLERANKISVDAARRIGVKEHLLANLTPQTQTDSRLESLASVRAALLSAKVGHTGSFPDFVGMADSLSRFYKEERRKQTGIYPQDYPTSFGFASPVNTLNTCAEMLFVALSHSSNMEQRGACLVLLNLLVTQTREVLPSLSHDVSTALSETLNFEANRPHFVR